MITDYIKTVCNTSHIIFTSLLYTLSTGEKPYHCTNDGCGKSFTASHHLKNHQVTHSDQRFSCELENCNAGFSSKQLLLSHVQTNHHHHNSDMRTEPNIFTEDIMSSLLQGPVQAEDGQSMILYSNGRTLSPSVAVIHLSLTPSHRFHHHKLRIYYRNLCVT